MNRFTQIVGVAVFAGSMLLFGNALADAGRTGGPHSFEARIPAGQAVEFQIPFNAGAPALVSVAGDGRTVLQVVMYDDDGNVSYGFGYWDRWTVGMDVYRAGFFRVEVRNLGGYTNRIVVSTN